MGALLDPVVDRLTILSGALVCWHFDLLPRWAIAVLIGREIVTVLLAEMALRRNMELEINWLGRISVFAIMGAIFWTMVFESVVWNVLLVVGVACAVISTVIYARSGVAKLRAT